MFQLLYPLGLLAAIGVLVPILVHLWNIKSGKTLKIGSVALLGLPSNQRSRSLKITNWPLLLLRCLLIFLIAFLLAAPAYRTKQSTSAKPGWILVEKANLPKLWNSNKKQLDSLILKGYELHDFDVNFARIDLKDTLTKFSRSAKPPLSYYSLLKQLDPEKGRRMYLYTDNRLSRFDEKPPVLNLDLNWKFLPADSATSSWVADAYQANNQRFIKTKAHSTATGNYYSNEALSAPDTAGLHVDTTTLTVQIFQRNSSTDAAFVKAAVLALRQYTGRSIKVRSINSLAQVRNKASLVFYLSEQQPNASEIKDLPKGTTLFQYEGKKVQSMNSIIQDELGLALSPASLYKRTFSSANQGQNIWLDATGNPVLSLDSLSGIKRYHFYSRFQPDWNDLVWTEGMVLFLAPVVLPQAAADYAFRQDQRSSLVAHVSSPITAVKALNNNGISYVQKSLSTWLWWIVFLVLFLERWLSYRKNVQVI
jgi:hypothetical protein